MHKTNISNVVIHSLCARKVQVQSLHNQHNTVICNLSVKHHSNTIYTCCAKFIIACQCCGKQKFYQSTPSTINQLFQEAIKTTVTSTNQGISYILQVKQFRLICNMVRGYKHADYIHIVCSLEEGRDSTKVEVCELL